MTRFKNILLVLRGKNNEIETAKRAFRLAKTNKAKLTIVDVLDELPKSMKHYLKIVSAKELQKIVAEERLSEIQKFINSIQSGKRIKPIIKTLVGKPYIKIIQEVLRNKHDLVIKTPEGKGGAKEALFESVDISIMRKCPCAVAMSKPTKSENYARILVAVDPDPNDEVKTKLNNDVLELAVSVANSENSELHIVHAWSLYGEKALRGPRFRESGKDINKLLQDARNVKKKWLDELLGNYPLSQIKHNVYLLKGDPAVMIPRVANTEKVDLIIMGTACRTGLPGFLIGNTAESILYKVNCSVISLKPYGFKTPVRLKN